MLKKINRYILLIVVLIQNNCLMFQKSAIYTCNVAHKSMSVRVEVMNRTLIPICLNGESWGLQWPITAPGSEALLECPRYFVGRRVSRLCSMKDATTPEWQIPDFSSCLYEALLLPYNNVSILFFVALYYQFGICEELQ